MRDSASPTRGLQRAQPLVERLEFLLLHGELCRPGRGPRRAARPPPSSASSCRARPPAASCRRPRAGALVSCASFSMRPIVSSALAACFMPSFSLPICTSIAQTISFTRFAWTTACSTDCCWLSSALALRDDVLGQRVERGQALFGAAAQLVELRQRPELGSRLSFTVVIAAVVSSRASREVSRIFAVVLRQRRRRRPDLIELALERAGLARPTA